MADLLWVFDLDDTLHAASPYIFPSISKQMTAYLEQYLGMDGLAANDLRQRYWYRYGATLLGLVRHHGTNPAHFLHHTHQFDNLRGMLVYEARLNASLARLPGRKIIYSNAPFRYVNRVIDLMGIGAHFDTVVGIEESRYIPKPHPLGYYRLLKRYRVPPHRCIMVEDSLENLRTAHRIGMKTVWIHNHLGSRSIADLRLNTVCELPRHVDKLMGDLS